jgi:hypothetical protein
MIEYLDICADIEETDVFVSIYTIIIEHYNHRTL